MNSKFLLPIALLLFLAPVKISVGSTNADHISSQANTSKSTTDHSRKKDEHSSNTAHLTLEFPQDLNQTHSNSNSPDDGKSHDFHFTRLDKKRWRAILCFAAKVVLLIAHLCFLICTHIHTTS